MKILYQKTVRKKIFLLFFLLVGVIFLDPGGIISKWLKVDKPVQSKVIVCEGWLSSYYYDSIVSIFHKQQYDKILITGSKLPDGVLLSQNGKIILKNFGFSGPLKEKPEKKYIRIFLKGSKSGKEYAKCIVYKNNTRLSDTIEVKKKIHLFFREIIHPDDSLVIQFINDRYSKYSDRNIILKSCYIDNLTVNMHSNQVWLNYQEVYTNTDANSYSENTAKHLISKGIPKDKIFYLSSSSDGISKTYNTASDAISWLKARNIPSANVITADYHSKRTYFSYLKADPEYKIGVLLLDNKLHYNWIKTKIRLIKELSGSIFIKVMPRKILKN